MLSFVHLTVQLSDTIEQDSILNINILISFVSLLKQTFLFTLGKLFKFMYCVIKL